MGFITGERQVLDFMQLHNHSYNLALILYVNFPEKIRDLVITKLIPSWVSDESCGNDLFKLLVYLDVSRNPEIAEILFRSMIP